MKYSNLLIIISKIRNILYYYWFFIAHRSPNYRSPLSARIVVTSYVDQNWIGCPPLAADDPLLLHMMRGMALSAKNVGAHYNVVGVPDFNYR